MARDQEKEDLELRIQRLEDQLAGARARRQPADLSADELRAFIKVRDALGLDPDWGCGINECQPCILRCVIDRCIVRCIVRCDVECICGPCNFGGGFGGGLGGFGGGGRFGGLGD